jgi:hypothetical protein
MRLSAALKSAISIAALCLSAQGQTAPAAAPAKAAPVNDSKGMPPRVTPAEYQAHAQAGTVTIAAEFTGHSVATPQGTLTNEEYLVVEVGFFGPPEARANLSIGDFSLRIGGKKSLLPGQPYGVVLSSLKDPEWEPPVKVEKKSSMSTGGDSGGQGQGNDPPPVPKMTFPERRAMEQKVQKATLPEGDRALPVAGLIFFQYGGRTKGIKSVELVYNGPAGKATLALQP